MSTSVSPGGSPPASPRELLRPPPHRGPLIAAGAVLVTVGVALEEIRLHDKLATGLHLAILALAAAAIYALGVQVRPEGRPYAFQSVLLVCGLLLLFPALLTLADVLGADLGEAYSAGAFLWTSLLLAGAALWPAAARNSSICALIAAVALAVAAVSFVDWALDAGSATAYRWLLAVLALGYALASLALRPSAPRHSVQMINAAGLAVLAVALTGLLPAVFGALSPFGGAMTALPNGWELVVLAVGLGLIAYGAVDREPGPAYLGLANVLAFLVSAGLSDDETLLYWPALILVLGLGAMIVGLRPRAPLPPEPSAYTTGSVPLGSRAGEEEEPVVRVRDDLPPRP
jgi:hypothetical protein